MISTVVITQEQWAKLHRQLSKDYPQSVVIIREKMKKVLGLSVRVHREWEHDNNFSNLEMVETVRLDFYDELKKTFFLLKYSEYLVKPNIDST